MRRVKDVSFKYRNNSRVYECKQALSIKGQINILFKVRVKNRYNELVRTHAVVDNVRKDLKLGIFKCVQMLFVIIWEWYKTYDFSFNIKDYSFVYFKLNAYNSRRERIPAFKFSRRSGNVLVSYRYDVASRRYKRFSSDKLDTRKLFFDTYYAVEEPYK